MTSPDVVSAPAASKLMVPPGDVRGMVELDRSRFVKVVRMPFVILDDPKTISGLTRMLKPILLDPFYAKPIRTQLLQEDGDRKNMVVLDPDKVAAYEDLEPDVRKQLEDSGVTSLCWSDVRLTYDTWKHRDILDAVLPSEHARFSSFDVLGHVAQLNLKPHLRPFRHVIGSVLVDKIGPVQCAACKSEPLGESEFRNAVMEVVAGDPGTQGLVVTASENGFRFRVDLARTFFNVRLSNEHAHVVRAIPELSVVYDVFAGVGPFAVPAALERSCRVLANDLNPDAVHWLNHNWELNRKSHRRATGTVESHNMSGTEFLRTVVVEDVVGAFGCPGPDVPPALVVVMNLPALALDHLRVLHGLFHGLDLPGLPPVTVHCYLFAESAAGGPEVLEMVDEALGSPVDRRAVEFRIIKNVSRSKAMARVSFVLPEVALFDVPSKRPRLLEDEMGRRMTREQRQKTEGIFKSVGHKSLKATGRPKPVTLNPKLLNLKSRTETERSDRNFSKIRDLVTMVRRPTTTTTSSDPSKTRRPKGPATTSTKDEAQVMEVGEVSELVAQTVDQLERFNCQQ